MPISESLPISESFARIPIDSITIRRADRQRREIEAEDLKESIRRNGLINPIVVRADYDPFTDKSLYVLVAGERRLEACRQLGWTHVPVRFANSLSPIESSIIELEENIKRQDLSWDDLCHAVAKVHQLHRQLDPDWSHADTAEVCSLSRGTVSMYLRVSNELAAAPGENPAVERIKAAGTIREAFNVINRRDQRVQANALEEILGLPNNPPTHNNLTSPPSVAPSVESTILNLSFLDWAPSYTGPKFQFIHCDFPYSANPFGGSQGRGVSLTHYDDSESIFTDLIACLGANLERLASISCHFMFWYSAKRDPLDLLRTHLTSVEWQTYPLIWLKSDNAGVVEDVRHKPRHIYETCLIGSIGNRELVQLVGDAYSCPTDHRLHPSTKPESMLRHFFRMFVDDSTRVLDPTCGSGAAIRAAESLDAKQTIGLEIDPTHCEAARAALKTFRALRGIK